MVEVFKTNITDISTANAIIIELQQILIEANISFDLDDCDKILRIDSQDIDCQYIINHLKKLGYCCEMLDY